MESAGRLPDPSTEILEPHRTERADRVDTRLAYSAALLELGSPEGAERPGYRPFGIQRFGGTPKRHEPPVAGRSEGRVTQRAEDEVVAADTKRIVGLIASPLAAVIGLVIIGDLPSRDPAQNWL